MHILDSQIIFGRYDNIDSNGEQFGFGQDFFHVFIVRLNKLIYGAWEFPIYVFQLLFDFRLDSYLFLLIPLLLSLK